MYGIEILRGVIGLASLILISYLFSNNKKNINWKLVAVGTFLQIMFALGVMKINFIHIIFQWISSRFVTLIGIFHKGIEFLFGNLADPGQAWAFVFAIQVLPTIIIFSALSALLYYLGILQKICWLFAWLLSKSMKLSGAESLSTAANIFLGQTEAPIMIRPYLAAMNKSEILLIMVGGMANTAGSVLGAYVQMLGGTDPAAQSYYALHLLTQSIISAPAAIVVSKIMFPNPDESSLKREIKVPKSSLGRNALDAISMGTTDGLKLAVNVGAMLIVFTALIYLTDALLLKIGSLTHLNALIIDWTSNRYDGLSLRLLFGYMFAPLAWLIGTPLQDILAVGQLLGEKMMVNEFYAYGTLSKMLNENVLQSFSKSTLIVTYALSGFANFASIGIQIGGISTLAENQRENLSLLGIKALIGGTIACLMTACVAGMIYQA